MKFWKHFKTITHHRLVVLWSCFQVGLYWQGLTHDLSKYSPTEFLVGARYFQGDSSPNRAERSDKGYSESWMHHKGRNRHHYEYWTDMDMQTRTYVPVRMPRKYLAEQIMDRRAACMIYQGDAYTDSSAYDYFMFSREQKLMHPENRRELEFLLGMLAEKGEKTTFAYIKNHVLKGKPYPWETAEENSDALNAEDTVTLPEIDPRERFVWHSGDITVIQQGPTGPYQKGDIAVGDTVELLVTNQIVRIVETDWSDGDLHFDFRTVATDGSEKNYLVNADRIAKIVTRGMQ